MLKYQYYPYKPAAHTRGTDRLDQEIGETRASQATAYLIKQINFVECCRGADTIPMLE